jgi:hypothetical protein
MENAFKKFQFSFTIAIIVALVLTVTAAFALIDVINGTFDTDVSSWVALPNATITWNPEDHNGNMGSGSAEVASGSAFQCVPLTGAAQTPTTFMVDGWAKVPVGSLSTQTRITIQFTSDASCNTSTGSPFIVSGPIPDNSWQNLTLGSTSIPATAQGARYILFANNSGNVLYDDLTISIFGPTAITLRNLEANSSSGSLVMVALVALLLSGGSWLVWRKYRMNS